MNSIDNGINSKLAGLDGKPASRADGDGASARRAGATGTAAPSASPPAQDASAGEAVSLTRTAIELQQLEAQLRDTPGVDVERVETIRRAIADGRYTIDAQGLVDSLLKSERELG
mgnify:CR=1 FL=1